MKKILLLSIVSVIVSSGMIHAHDNSLVGLLNCPARLQAPFTFMNAVPEKVRINDGINLSFFVNQSIVFQYRYKLEVPKEALTQFESAKVTWSGWINNDIVELRIPKLSSPGKYKLVIEYRTHSGTQPGLFEKLFEVFQTEVKKGSEQAVKSVTKEAVTDPQTVTKPVTEPATAQTTKTEPSRTTQTTTVTSVPVPDKTVQAANTKPSATDLSKTSGISQETGRTILPDTVTFITREEKIPETIVNPVKPVQSLQVKNIEKGEIIAKDYNKLLVKAIESKDLNLFRESLLNGADTKISGVDGGNIFHLLTGKIENEEFLTLLKKEGNLIDKIDNFGNSPLHLSILSGRTDYAVSLLHQGAGMNNLNSAGLSPLHLAVCVNNVTIVRELIKSGADVNIQGNTDYTPLHIASELNNPDIAKELLTNDAVPGIKTGQKFNSLKIAKIQNNQELEKLIKSKGRYLHNSVQPSTLLSMESAQQGKYPIINFTLPYEIGLVRKRNTDKIIQWITVPMLAVCAASSVYFKLEAENNFSKYKEASSLDEARAYYDKTKKYDTYTFISVGVGVIPLYGLIHSSINKIKVTKRMKKTF